MVARPSGLRLLVAWFLQSRLPSSTYHIIDNRSSTATSTFHGVVEQPILIFVNTTITTFTTLSTTFLLFRGFAPKPDQIIQICRACTSYEQSLLSRCQNRISRVTIASADLRFVYSSIKKYVSRVQHLRNNSNSHSCLVLEARQKLVSVRLPPYCLTEDRAYFQSSLAA